MISLDKIRQTAGLVNIIPDRVNQTSKARFDMREAREHGYCCFGTAFIAQRKPTSWQVASSASKP